jgi:uncharacterized protein YbbC (DUF1343 family)
MLRFISLFVCYAFFLFGTEKTLSENPEKIKSEKTELERPDLEKIKFQKVNLGVDVFFAENQDLQWKDKKVGLITNQTGVDHQLESTLDLFKKNKNFSLSAIFSPEHGFTGSYHAEQTVENSSTKEGIPIYSLYGKTRRPTEEMLKNIDVLFFDIQEIGTRSYTYINTLFFVMEEAAKKKIPVVVFDRPNPINGITVDGPMLDKKWRSFIGYINIPYCHGMTIGELATFFNEEYHISCDLHVVQMKHWKRWMSFSDTGLTWVPPSPHIPEAETVFFYPMTGILGELSMINIGIGYTLPFKVIGAPWIDAKKFAKELNDQNLPGVSFVPFHYRPFYGTYKGEECHGVLIVLNDPKIYQPVAVQYVVLGLLKSLYPKEFGEKLNLLKASQKELFCKANGTEEVYQILLNNKYPCWKLTNWNKKQREEFLLLRKKYLFTGYN